MNYTTIEQSKKLVKLGLNPNTADMLWEQHIFESPYVTVKPYTTKGKSIGAHILPCWSLGALLEVMPKTMKGIPEKAAYSLTLKENSYNAWKCNYVHFSFGELYEFPAQPTPLKATYEMVCWLLENGYIKKGE